MNRSFKLYRLQHVDSQLDQVRTRLDEIESLLAEDNVVREATDAASEAESAERAAENELRRAEEEVKAQQLRIEQNQSSLYGGLVKNPKELQDLQLEAEALTRHLQALEDIQIEKMMGHDAAQVNLKAAQDNLEGVRAQRAVENRTLGSEQTKLTEEQQRLVEERASTANGISNEDMAAYLDLRKSKGGLAIAKVQNKSCVACGAELSASLAQAARSPNELARCSSCKRILYAG